MGIHSANGAYKAFAQQRDALTGLLGRSAGVIDQLNMTQFRDDVEILQKKVQNEAFKIMVVGTFKNGKSTFINSFLGEDILPAYSIPCTAVINEVKYGEKKRAVLHFRDPLPEKLPEDLAPLALEHMQRHGMQHIPPLEIPYDEIEDYVVIPMGEDPAEMLLESPYHKVELFWPLELLKNGVEIIDSPGLNEHATRTRVTMEYLARADAILMVLNAQQLCSEREMAFIAEDLKNQGFTDPFFVVNRFDCVSAREKEAVRRFAVSKLQEYTSFGASGIYFLSALDALEGKQNEDPIQFNASGMGPFEQALSDFLLGSKGKIKLAQPARELKRMLTDEALFKVIPMQRKMLGSDLAQVKARYEAMQPKLRELTDRKERLRGKLEMRIERSRREFTQLVREGIRELETQIPQWVQEFTPNAQLGLVPNEAKLKPVMKEISDHITEKMGQQQRLWREKSLAPALKQITDEIFDMAQSDAARILEQIDRLHGDMVGRQADSGAVLQRILGSAGSFGLENLNIAGEETTEASSKFTKTLAFEVGAGAVLVALGMLNPLTIFLTLAGSFLYSWTKGEEKALTKLKKTITDNVVKQLSETREANADKTVDMLMEKLRELADSFLENLEQEITEFGNQMQAVIKEMEQGQEQVTHREQILSLCEEQIRKYSMELDELIFSLVKG